VLKTLITLATLAMVKVGIISSQYAISCRYYSDVTLVLYFKNEVVDFIAKTVIITTDIAFY